MAGSIPDYDELRLRVERSNGGYRVVAFGPDGATATGHFAVPMSKMELDNFVLRLTRSGGPVRSYRSSQMEEARQLGGALFDRLLADDVGDIYHGARKVADSRGRGLRIALYMTGAAELLEIPWELLYDRDEAYFLSQSIYTPVVRALDLKSPPAPAPTVTLPLRVLALASAPQGFPPLDVASEREKLETALGPMIEGGAVSLEWLESATLSELERRVGAPDELHVIHYVGHGSYDERTQSGILVFEDAHGGPHEVTGEELGGCLRDERSLRLVVLNSCEGGRASHVDPFSGVASSLLRCGLPAVVGMQAEITDEAAVTFADRLYSALAQGFPIDAALAQTRRAIFAAGRDAEFGTPVLFMRVADGRIFDVADPAPPRPVERKEAEEAGPPPPPPPPDHNRLLVAAMGAGALVLVAVILLLAGVIPGGDDDSGGGGSDGSKATVTSFRVGTDVGDLDARGDKIAYIAPSSAPGASEIRRLDPDTGRSAAVSERAPRYEGVDVGLDASDHARLAYSRCDDSGTCRLFTQPFRGHATEVPVATDGCSDSRPSMWLGMILFSRSGAACEQPGLLLKRRGGAVPETLVRGTAGADLNGGYAVWLSGDHESLVARAVTPGGQLSSAGTLHAAAGESFQAPIVVEDGYVYFVHQQSHAFISRAQLPLGGSVKIEHFSIGPEDAGAAEAPHFGVSATTLYVTNYPQPNGDSGAHRVVRVRTPSFEPAS